MKERRHRGAPRELSRADSLEILSAGLVPIGESRLIRLDSLREPQPQLEHEPEHEPERGSFAEVLRHPAAPWRVAVAAIAGAALAAVVFETPVPPVTPALVEVAPRILEPTTAAVAPSPAPLDEVTIVEDEPTPPPKAARTRARDAARALTQRAATAKAIGDNQRASKLYRRALDALPTYAPAAADLARMHLDRGEYSKALRFAKQALRGAPRKIPYMILVGDLQHLLRNDDAARRHWQLAADYGSAKAARRLARLDPDS